MKSKIALVVAIMLGVVAVVGVRRYVEEERVRARRGFRLIRVVAASRALKPGVQLTPKDVAPKTVTESSLLDESILWDERERILGETLARSVARDGQVLWTFLVRQADESTADLLPGERALTVPVDLVSGVGGLLKPGCRVDVFGTFIMPTTAGRGQGPASTQTMLILPDVPILAVDNITADAMARASFRKQKKFTYSTLTLAVTTLEAQVLTFAQSQGKLTMALRRAGDVSTPGDLPEVNITALPQLVKQIKTERDRRARQKLVEPTE